MSEIILRLPSKGTQYGYVEVKGTPEEFGIETGLHDPTVLAVLYANYVGTFQATEKAQKAVSGPAHPALAPEVKVFPEELQTALRDAEQALRGDAPEEVEAAALDVVESILGPTTVVDETVAPWEAEAPAAKPKPWEKSGAPKVAPVVNLFG